MAIQPLKLTRLAAPAGVLLTLFAIPLASVAQSATLSDSSTLVSTPPTSAESDSAAAAAVVATVVAGDEGFALRSADGDFALRLRGGMHYDGRFFLGDDTPTAIDQLQLRHIRTDLQATAFQDYDFRLNVEYSGSRVELQDAYGNLRLAPAVQIRAGKTKGPLGLERMQSVWSLLFAERAFPSSLVPNRDIGVQLHGVLRGGAAEYAIGVFNGVPDGGSADLDDDDAKDLNARIFLRPLRGRSAGPLEGLGFGVGVSIGDQNGTPEATGLSAYRSGGRELFFRYRADGTVEGTAVVVGRRTRVSPQISWYWRNLSAFGEFVSVHQPIALGNAQRKLRNTAWQVAGSIVLTGETPSFTGVDPARPFAWAAGGWGAVELAGRVTALSVDDATFPTFADPGGSVARAIGYAGGVNWYLNRAVRLLLNYERTNYTPAPDGIERAAENVLITRLEFFL